MQTYQGQSNLLPLKPVSAQHPGLLRKHTSTAKLSVHVWAGTFNCGHLPGSPAGVTVGTWKISKCKKCDLKLIRRVEDGILRRMRIKMDCSAKCVKTDFTIKDATSKCQARNLSYKFKTAGFQRGGWHMGIIQDIRETAKAAQGAQHDLDLDETG